MADSSRRYSRKAKIKKNITPHTFRHTCATLMLRNKANIRHIQELLGHSSLGLDPGLYISHDHGLEGSTQQVPSEGEGS